LSHTANLTVSMFISDSNEVFFHNEVQEIKDETCMDPYDYHIAVSSMILEHHSNNIDHAITDYSFLRLSTRETGIHYHD